MWLGKELSIRLLVSIYHKKSYTTLGSGRPCLQFFSNWVYQGMEPESGTILKDVEGYKLLAHHDTVT